MKIYAISDIHIDYKANKEWMLNLSSADYQNDILILAGDITDNLEMLELCFRTFADRFHKVLYVPGNHDLWVVRDPINCSFEKFDQICALTEKCGVSMKVYESEAVAIVPLLSWYDFSFGEPSKKIMEAWSDFHTCKWPQGMDMDAVTQHFLKLNEPVLDVKHKNLITFSHFLPRIDVMPGYIPSALRYVYPVLGTSALDLQVRKLMPKIHVYGHSHVNRRTTIAGIRYINNAYGYPSEKRITKKRLISICEV